MISDCAVEAAAKALWANARIDPWEEARDYLAAEFRHNARLALEAAEPDMLRPAKEDAWTEGCENGLSYNPGYDEEALAANPYRTTK